MPGIDLQWCACVEIPRDSDFWCTSTARKLSKLCGNYMEGIVVCVAFTADSVECLTLNAAMHCMTSSESQGMASELDNCWLVKKQFYLLHVHSTV